MRFGPAIVLALAAGAALTLGYDYWRTQQPEHEPRTPGQVNVVQGLNPGLETLLASNVSVHFNRSVLTEGFNLPLQEGSEAFHIRGRMTSVDTNGILLESVEFPPGKEDRDIWIPWRAIAYIER